MKQWREYLRPSGWLLLSVPAHQDHYGAADELVGHYRRYERETLSARAWRTPASRSCGSAATAPGSVTCSSGSATSSPRRVLAQQGEEGDTPEERTSGSGRLFQPRRVATAVACATVAAPARLAQAPFAGSDLGTGYVVLARRSE